MGDTIKIRQLRPSDRPGGNGTTEEVALGSLDRVVEDVKIALMTTGLTLEGEKAHGQDPYNNRPAAKTRDAWSDRSRRR